MPSYSTPPHRPTRDFWLESVYYLDVSGLPAKGNSAAIVEAAADIQDARNSVRHVRLDPHNNADWLAGRPAGYFVDTLPGPASSYYRTWTVRTPQSHHDRQHVWFNNLRQQGAARNPFTGAFDVVRDGDRHAICWAEDDNELLEVYAYNGVSYQFANAAQGCDHAVTWDLTSYDLPFGPNGVTKVGATATRFPVAPFFATHQDFLDAQGDPDGLGHMLAFTLWSYSPLVQWPARQGDGDSTVPNAPKAGEILRLPADFDVDSMPTEHHKTLARTLMKYGMCLVDRSGAGRILLPNDPLWPNSFSNDAGTFGLELFEAVDISSVQGSPNSIRLAGVEPPPPPPPNQAPVAAFSLSPASGTAPLPVSFDGSGSADPDGSIVDYAWDFGDGDTGSGQTTTHTYTTPGTYTPSLTVTDNDGATDTAVADGWSPRYPLDTPPGRVRYGAFYNGNLTDRYETPSGVPLAMSREFFSWAGRGGMDARVVANAAAGRATWLSFKTPVVDNSWADVAAGLYETSVDAMLAELRDTGINCWLTPFHEPEDNVGTGGVAESEFGTPAQWRAMVRYIEARRKVVGADNVLIVPILSAWTFNTSSGRNPVDWVLTEDDFPLQGVDTYWDTYDTSPPGFSNTWWNRILSFTAGKDRAIGEMGGDVNSRITRPPELWWAMVAEAEALDFKAVLWFDGSGSGEDTLNQSPADPTGELYAAILDTFAGETNYYDGLVVGETIPGGTVTVGGTATLPTAVAALTSTVGLTVGVSAAGSGDPDGSIASYSWDWGDGTPDSTGATATHTYAADGDYTVTLTVTDDDDNTDTDTLALSVAAPVAGCVDETRVLEWGLLPDGVEAVTPSPRRDPVAGWEALTGPSPGWFEPRGADEYVMVAAVTTVPDAAVVTASLTASFTPSDIDLESTVFRSAEVTIWDLTTGDYIGGQGDPGLSPVTLTLTDLDVTDRAGHDLIFFVLVAGASAAYNVYDVAATLDVACSTASCPTPEYVGVRGGDSSTGGGGTETISYSGTPTAGNLLLLTYTHGGANGTGFQPSYTTPSGWTFVGQAYNGVNNGGVEWFASTVVYAKIADGTETGSFPLVCTSAHIGRGVADIREFTGTAGLVAEALDVVHVYDGRPGNPTASEVLADVAPDSAVWWAITTAAPTGGSPPNLTLDDAAGFTTVGFGADTTYKSARLYREGASGDVALPVVTNTEASPPELWPYAAVAVSLVAGEPPTAAYTLDDTEGPLPHLVNADASPSLGGGGTIVSYEWDWGDGNTDTGVAPNHTYATAGNYVVTLTVTNSVGCTASSSALVSVLDATVDYLPIVGTCGIVDDRYLNIDPETETFSFLTSNGEWAVDWAATPAAGSMRWAATFTALVDLPYSSLTVLGGTITNDGGLGDGPTPSGISTDAAAATPVLSGVGGVTLDPLVSTPTAAGVNVAGGATFDAGATFSIAFSVPAEYPTYMAFAIPGNVVDESGTTIPDLFASASDLSIAWTGTCPSDPCAATVALDGAYVASGDGIVWEPTILSIDGGPGALYFLGAAEAPLEGPTIAGIDLPTAPDGVLVGPLPQPGYTLGAPLAEFPEAVLTGYRITGATCGSYVLYLYGRRLEADGPIELWASTDGDVWTEVPTAGPPDAPGVTTDGFELLLEGDCTDCTDALPVFTVGQLGTCAIAQYRVDLMARGGKVRVGALTDLVDVRYGRRLDGVSDATVTVAKRGPDCCRELNEADPYATELRIWRHGEVVWEGPVYQVDEGANEVVIDARDVAHWTEVHTIRELIDDSTDPGRDACLIAGDILSAAFRHDDPNVLDYVWIVPGASKVTRKTDPANRPFAYAELSDLANSVIDWTVIGRRIVVCPTDEALGSAGWITSDDIASDDWKIRKLGRAFVSRQITAGEGALVAIAGGRSSRYGLVERVNQETRFKTQLALNAAAADRYKVTPRPPVWVSLDDQVTLRPETATTIAELVPGALLDGRFVRGCTTLQQRFRLQRVDVTADAAGEKVSIGATATDYADPIVDTAYDDLVVIGDSMTALNSSLIVAESDRWIDLTASSGIVGHIWYGAAPGATTTTLRENPVTDPRAADALVVFLGANDMNTTIPELGVDEITPEQYRDGLLWFVENYPAPRRVIVFPWRWRNIGEPGNPYYIPGVPVAEPTYQAYRAAAREAANTAGAAFVDLSLAVPEATDDYVVDWIHPTAVGHRLIADLVRAAL